jgi:tetratricopeptide (TPR) repeat protein
MLRPHEAVRLLSEPTECLKLLEFLTSHPSTSSVNCCEELHISLRTWYSAVDRLDELELVHIQRVPGGSRIRRIEVTPHGRAVLKLLEGLPGLIGHSPAGLGRELSLHAKGIGPGITAESLCRLIEHAHRRGEVESLKDIKARALAANRPGEAALALAVASYLRGDMRAANDRFESSMRLMENEPESRSFRRALYFHGFTLDAIGRGKEAYEALTRLRRLAREAHDVTLEGDARMGIGILKARRGQFEDAARHLEKALECGQRAGSLHRQATVLTTLCMVDFFLDHGRGLARSEEALAAARRSGGQVLLMHVHSNRALMLAVLGRKAEALGELTMSRKLSRIVGHERGHAMLEEWAALVRRILRQRQPGNLGDWRDQAIRILQKPPSQSPEELLESPPGRAPSQSG